MTSQTNVRTGKWFPIRIVETAISPATILPIAMHRSNFHKAVILLPVLHSSKLGPLLNTPPFSGTQEKKRNTSERTTIAGTGRDYNSTFGRMVVKWDAALLIELFRSIKRKLPQHNTTSLPSTTVPAIRIRTSITNHFPTFPLCSVFTAARHCPDYPPNEHERVV